MNTTFLVILIAVIAVGLLVVGLSLTLIFKGHNIKSEIGENENMRAHGIRCAAEEMRESDSEFYGRSSSEARCGVRNADCGMSGCAACHDIKKRAND